MPPQLLDELIKNASLFDAAGNLWIFGYGSLIWKPGFNYHSRVVGYITDYKRRFYQGTTTHRGTEDWPGRVATLIPCKDQQTWGVAYQVSDAKDIRLALAHLAEREMITGGYRFDKVLFQPVINSQVEKPATVDAFTIQVYIAEPGNDQWLGKATLSEQAFQIARARGVCGHNTEYAKKVAVFMSEEVRAGRSKDRHLFALVELMEMYSDAGEAAETMLDSDTLMRLPRKVAQSRADSELIASVRLASSTSSSNDTCACSKLKGVREVQPELYDESRMRRSTLAELERHCCSSSNADRNQ